MEMSNSTIKAISYRHRDSREITSLCGLALRQRQHITDLTERLGASELSLRNLARELARLQAELAALKELRARAH